MDSARAVRIIDGDTNALHAAHEVGPSYRDVVPSNIQIDRDNCAHLTDFGLAPAAGKLISPAPAK
jgi:serine/threonine protein kinase